MPYILTMNKCKCKECGYEFWKFVKNQRELEELHDYVCDICKKNRELPDEIDAIQSK